MENKIKKDDLVKALTDVGFSEEDIEQAVEKAMEEGKLDTEEPGNEEGNEEKEEMEKALQGIAKLKGDLQKAESEFLDRFGNVEGFTKPTEFITKSEQEIEELAKQQEAEIRKSIEEELENNQETLFKSEDFKDDLVKGVVDSMSTSFTEKFENIQKSITTIQEEVKAIADAPNPLKGIFGNYQKELIQKSVDAEGNASVSMKDKNSTLNLLESAKTAAEKAGKSEDVNILKGMISDFNITNTINNDHGLNIVKSYTDIDIEK